MPGPKPKHRPCLRCGKQRKRNTIGLGCETCHPPKSGIDEFFRGLIKAKPPKAKELDPQTLYGSGPCSCGGVGLHVCKNAPSPSFTGGGKPQQPIEYRACEKCQRPFPCSHEFQGKPICYGCFVPTKPERCPLHNPDIAWAPQCEMCSFYEEREWRKELLDALSRLHKYAPSVEDVKIGWAGFEDLRKRFT